MRGLYATGMLHNHARMWLASYVVHVRKVHWRAGADWLYGHLLDGDLASNHLSWQWVAGTGSAKPYLFNAENVARFAPAAWHSPGSVIDTSYEALDAWARSPAAPPAAPLRDGIGEAVGDDALRILEPARDRRGQDVEQQLQVVRDLSFGHVRLLAIQAASSGSGKNNARAPRKNPAASVVKDLDHQKEGSRCHP